MGGTAVKVLNSKGVEVGSDRVAVGEAGEVAVIAPWVAIALKVCAAEVYKALRVAAGCGAAGAVNVLHANIMVRASKGSRIFLARVFNINVSVWIKTTVLNARRGDGVPE